MLTEQKRRKNKIWEKREKKVQLPTSHGKSNSREGKLGSYEAWKKPQVRLHDFELVQLLRENFPVQLEFGCHCSFFYSSLAVGFNQKFLQEIGKKGNCTTSTYHL